MEVMGKTQNQNTKKIDKESVIPMYYQLAKIFEEKIFVGIYKPGEKLPPENQIAKEYEISRMTVRKAISELIDAGMVYSQKGKGTFVAKPKLENVVFELENFSEEIKKMGMQPQTKFLKARIIRADQSLARKLSISQGTKCLYFQLLTSAQNEPLIYENKYVVYTKQKPILESELTDPSLSNLATLHGDYFPTKSKKVLHASTTNQEEAAVLEVEVDAPVFMIEQTLYDADEQPIGWGKSICRGDRFKLTSNTGWSID